MRFLRGKEEAVTTMEDLKADLAEAKQRLAELEAEAEFVERRVTLAALAGVVEESTLAQMRRAALPVEINRATLAVVAAELSIVRERRERAEEEVREFEADEEHRSLRARWFALSRGEKRKKNRLDARLRIATEKLRPLEERERQLLARKRELEEAGREWPSPEGGAREGAA